MSRDKTEENRYPARSRRECVISRIVPGRRTWIAGRLHVSAGGELSLRDASGSIALKSGDDFPPGAGDIVDLFGEIDEKGIFRIVSFDVLAPGRDLLAPGSVNDRLRDAGSVPFLRRNLVRDSVRSFFFEKGFLEVETPVLVPVPGQEPHLEPFRTTIETLKGKREGFLITSPEHNHKRLLAAGHEKIFEITRAFRNGPEEGQGLHWYEFTLLEWYRAFASYLEIMEDVENLIAYTTVHTSRAAGGTAAGKYSPPFRRLTVSEAFQDLARVDLAPFLAGEQFAVEEAARGDYGLSPEDRPAERFFKILIGGVEPALQSMGPVFLVDYPASQAALSKVKSDDPALCERFELYIDGVELANGFSELNDPVEQRRRFRENAALRAEEGRAELPVDEDFLEALDIGMPPAGGVALGLERLMMVLYGEKEITSFQPFSMK